MAEEPTAATTLAILAGASDFERLPDAAQGSNFLASANDFLAYLRSSEGLGLPEKNILNLFNSKDAGSVLLEQMETFLEDRTKELDDAKTRARDFIFYYLGHGGFTQDKKYRLAVRSTRKGAEDPSSIRMSDLARSINGKAGGMRKYVILDCCFSAAAFASWQSSMQSAPTEVVRVQVQEALPPGPPETGTTILCSSSALDPSEAPANAQYTMFSGALIQALREGVPRAGPRITMAQLGEQVSKLIFKQYKNESVRPEVLCPDQREDETKDVPIFPNPALRLRNFDCTLTVLDSERIALDYINEEGKSDHVEGVLGDDVSLTTVRRMSQWLNLGLVLEQDRTLRGFNESTDRALQLRSSDDLRVLGTNLYRLMFGAETLRQAFCGVYVRFQNAMAASTPGLRMRIRLAFRRQADEVARLPWEFLFVPDGDQGSLDNAFFVGRRTDLLFTRYTAVQPRPRQLTAEPLKILVAIYTPAGEAPFEHTTLLTNLKAIPNAKVIVMQDVSVAALGKALEDEKPHVFHFVGFGTRDGNGGLTFIGRQEDSREQVYQPDDKIALPLSGDNLLTLFSYDPKPGFIFLQGCKSSGGPLDGFQRQESLTRCARELLTKVSPTVVTMQLPIAAEEVGYFAASAYAELAKGNGPDEAVHEGRQSLGKIPPKWTHPRFAAPMVLMQNDDPLVLPPKKEADKTDKIDTKSEATPSTTSGSAVATSPQRPGASDALKDATPAPAQKDQTATSSFESR